MACDVIELVDELAENGLHQQQKCSRTIAFEKLAAPDVLATQTYPSLSGLLALFLKYPDAFVYKLSF